MEMVEGRRAGDENEGRDIEFTSAPSSIARRTASESFILPQVVSLTPPEHRTRYRTASISFTASMSTLEIFRAYLRGTLGDLWSLVSTQTYFV
eukprot:767575-Hanusia_phi.AAC.2